jgi:hypothetical protein
LVHIATSPYPGESASPHDLLDLAHAYYTAAIHLFHQATNLGGGFHEAPARLCAIHAIELYRNAFLRFREVDPKDVRKRGHTLWDEDFVAALGLRKKTAAHLLWIEDNREYLSVRYAPDLLKAQSQSNRILATLREIMMKSDRIRSEA